MGALRLFLAYGVVLDHLRGFLIEHGMSWHADWALGVVGGGSVYFFYIISGFLMSYVLESKYPRTQAGTYQFYKSRFLRIYPLWWAVVAVCAAGIELSSGQFIQPRKKWQRFSPFAHTATTESAWH